MSKTFVLDTNVILSDPLSIFAFEDNDVVVPSIVIQEIDNMKRRMDEVGRNARMFNEVVDQLREVGSLSEGVALESGGTLKVVYNQSKSVLEEVVEMFNDFSNDTQIVALALELSLYSKNPVTLVSKDANVRLKADAIRVNAENYLNDRVVYSDDSLYTGYRVLETSPENINKFYKDGKIVLEDEDFNENEFAILKNGSQSALAKFSDGALRKLYNFSGDLVWGLSPKNVEQEMALELILDPNVPLVTLTGKAGTGKTLIAIASALKLIEDDHKYKKLLVARPVVPLGKDIGYLPGEKDEKLRPWMQPIYDNLEFLFDCKGDPAKLDKIMMGMSSIQVEALTYIRGRSIPEQFIIIDEAQNLTRHEVKTILTRVGEGSKIVLTGDPDQIDHPYLDQYNNGLTYVIEKMKKEKLAGHVTLSKGVRSGLAQLCADIL